jgi:hypothetical protein
MKTRTICSKDLLLSYECKLHVIRTCVAFQLLGQKFPGLNLSILSSAARTAAQYFKSRSKSYY